MKIRILLLALLLTGCQMKKTDNLDSIATPRTNVSITHIEQGSISSSIVLSATTVYQRKTTLSAPISSFIVRAMVFPGEVVKRGRTLFLLESKESKALGSASGLENIAVKASCSGLVTEVMQQTGTYIPEGTPLCVIADLSSMVFELNVPYEQQKNVRSGSNCQIVLPDETKLSARLERPLLSVDSQSQTQNYVAKCGKHPFLPEGLVVKASVGTHIAGGNHQILPKAAVQSDETMTDFWVMTIGANSIAHKISVTVGSSNSKEIEILSPRFSPSERIVCDGGYGLTDGSFVKVVKP